MHCTCSVTCCMSCHVVSYIVHMLYVKHMLFIIFYISTRFRTLLSIHGLAACRTRCPPLLVSSPIKGPVPHTQAARSASRSPHRDFQASHPLCEWLTGCASTVHCHHECYLFSTGANSMMKLWSVCHYAFSVERIVYDGLSPVLSPSPAV